MNTLTVAPVMYRTPCRWCLLYRSGCAPNYVQVSVPKSDGICPACAETMREQIRKRAAKVPA
jgi:hypothetical protein